MRCSAARCSPKSALVGPGSPTCATRLRIWCGQPSFHGVPTDIACPVCRKESLTHVYWVYGDEIKHIAGSARLPAELETMAGSFGEFSVYQVEVCRTCSWNHLVSSFVMGSKGDAAPRTRRRAVK